MQWSKEIKGIHDGPQGPLLWGEGWYPVVCWDGEELNNLLYQLPPTLDSVEGGEKEGDDSGAEP